MNPALEQFFGTPETVLRLAAAMQQVSATLMELRTTLDSRVSSLVPSPWRGPAAAAFQKHWGARSDAIPQAAETAARMASARETRGTGRQTAKRLFHPAAHHALAKRPDIPPAPIV